MTTQASSAPTEALQVESEIKPSTEAKKVKRQTNLKVVEDKAATSRPVVIHKNSKSRAVVSRTVTVGSLICQSIFRRNIDYMAFKLFNLSVIIPVLSANDIQTKVIDETLENLFDDTLLAFNNGIVQIQTLLKANEIESDDACKFDNPMSKEVKLDNPHTIRYIQCLTRLDELLRLLAHAWICGLIDSPSKKKLDSTWREYMMKLQRSIKGLEDRARGAIRNKGIIDEARKHGAEIDDRPDEAEQNQNLQTEDA